MAYKIIIEKRIIKTLAEIDEPYHSAIEKALYNLSNNPRPGGYKKLKGRDGYRIRVGYYRIVYDILDKMLIVKILTIGNRKDVYD